MENEDPEPSCRESEAHDGTRKHDAITVVAISVIAFVVADLSHEALGHGIAARLQGAKLLVLSYTYLTSDLQSRLISAAGPLVNLIEGLTLLGLLHRIRMQGNVHYFVVLLMIYNLLEATAYLIYSGVLGSGDLGVVIAGLPHSGTLRLVMVIAGIALYAMLTQVGSRELRRFVPERSALTTPAYLSAIVLNCAAALLNPLGLKYFLISALPTTAGAHAGLLAMPLLAEKSARTPDDNLWVTRSFPWIAAGVIVAACFIFLIGPGVRLR